MNSGRILIQYLFTRYEIRYMRDIVHTINYCITRTIQWKFTVSTGKSQISTELGLDFLHVAVLTKPNRST